MHLVAHALGQFFDSQAGVFATQQGIFKPGSDDRSG
jgi:hypothetical protein